MADFDWPEYLMGFARHAATKSKDTTQVGAALVAPHQKLGGRVVILTGYNGPPAGVRDLLERRVRPTKYLFASHAEANLIAFAGRMGIMTARCTVYCTHHPCAVCARLLIQAGIQTVVYEQTPFGPGSAIDAEVEASRTMLIEANVSIITLEAVTNALKNPPPLRPWSDA